MIIGLAGALGAGALAQDTSAPRTLTPPEHSQAKAFHKGHWGVHNRQALRRVRRQAQRRLARFLGLTREQRSALRHIRAKTLAAVWTARADEHLTKAQRVEALKTAAAAGRASFRSLLTPAQTAKLEQVEQRPEQLMIF